MYIKLQVCIKPVISNTDVSAELNMKWRNPAEQGSTDNKTDDWVKFFFFFWGGAAESSFDQPTREGLTMCILTNMICYDHSIKPWNIKPFRAKISIE